MAMALPIALFAGSVIKSYLDNQQAQSEDDAMRQAGQQKLQLMQQGAQQMDKYRQGLVPAELTAMNNRMQAYTPAQNVLSQMYGGKGGSATPPMGRVIPGPQQGPGNFSAMANNPLYGASPTVGRQINVGFGGEMPMPMDLAGRKL